MHEKSKFSKEAEMLQTQYKVKELENDGLLDHGASNEGIMTQLGKRVVKDAYWRMEDEYHALQLTASKKRLEELEVEQKKLAKDIEAELKKIMETLGVKASTIDFMIQEKKADIKKHERWAEYQKEMKQLSERFKGNSAS